MTGPTRLALWLLLCAAARAAESLPASETAGRADTVLSSMDTLALAWDQLAGLASTHPSLLAAEAAVREARFARAEAAGLPDLSAEVRRFSADPRDGGPERPETELGLALSLDWLWTHSARRDQAEALHARRQHEQAGLGRELTFALGESYWSLVRDQEMSRTSSELAQHLEDLLQVARTRVRLGDARPVEASQVEIEALKARLEADGSAAQLELSRTRLARWLTPASGLLWASSDPFRIEPADALQDSGDPLSDNPRLRSAQADVAEQEATRKLEWLGILPRLQLEGSLERADDRLARGIGVGLEIPLFTLNRAGIARSKAGLQRARAELQAERRRLDDELDTARSNFHSSQAQAESWRKQILPRAEEAALVMEHTWQLGETGLLELIDAQRTLAETKREAIRVFHQAHLDRLRLQLLLEKESH